LANEGKWVPLSEPQQLFASLLWPTSMAPLGIGSNSESIKLNDLKISAAKMLNNATIRLPMIV